VENPPPPQTSTGRYDDRSPPTIRCLDATSLCCPVRSVASAATCGHPHGAAAHRAIGRSATRAAYNGCTTSTRPHSRVPVRVDVASTSDTVGRGKSRTMMNSNASFTQIQHKTPLRLDRSDRIGERRDPIGCRIAHSTSQKRRIMTRGIPTASPSTDWNLRELRPETDEHYGRHFEGHHGEQCSHCNNEATARWRTGPRGPRTLCNACGVHWMYYRNPHLLESSRASTHRSYLRIRKQKQQFNQVRERPLAQRIDIYD